MITARPRRAQMPSMDRRLQGRGSRAVMDGKLVVYNQTGGLWRRRFGRAAPVSHRLPIGVCRRYLGTPSWWRIGVLTQKKYRSSARTAWECAFWQKDEIGRARRAPRFQKAWSADDTRLLIHRGKDKVVVSVADGTATVVVAGGDNPTWSFRATPNAFSPDGHYIVYHNVDDKAPDPANARMVIWIADAFSARADQILSRSPRFRLIVLGRPDHSKAKSFQNNQLHGSEAIWQVAMADGKATGEPQLVSSGNLRSYLDARWRLALL